MPSLIVMSVAWLVVTQSAVPTETAPETAGLLRPTQVRLDFDNRTLAEIVTEINAQSSTAVMLPPEPAGLLGAGAFAPAVAPHRFSLHEPAALPFWEAIDRVCRATRRWPGIAVLRDPLAREPGPAGHLAEPDLEVVLVPASGDRGFACADRVFRVVVARVNYGRDIRFAPALFVQPRAQNASHDRPGDKAFFSADLIVMVEPRLRFQRLGDVTVREAADDRGHDLIVAGSAREHLQDRQGLIPPDGAAVTVPVALAYPGEPGKLIKRLRGSMHLEVTGRKPGSPTVATDVSFDFAGLPMP